MLLAVFVTSQTAQAQTPLVQFKAANYNAGSGLWTDSSGNNNNAQASGTYPTLAATASPNGSPAVVFNGANQLQLTTGIPTNVSYTIFAFIKPSVGAGPYALCGGAAGAFEYRINNSKQNVLRQQQLDLGSETTAMSTTAFSLIDATVTTTGTAANGTFRLNGANDGTNVPSSLGFPATINAIGARAAVGGENFSGSVCEIDIYSGILTPTQITNIEAALTAAYVTPPPTAPVVITDTTASPSVATVNGNDTLSATFTGAAPISYQWQFSLNANGSGAVNINGATNTTLTLTNLHLSDSGKYYSLRATNAVSPYVTYSTWLQLNVVPLVPLVQLVATNYSPGGASWTDSSGNFNDAYYTGTTAPTLNSFATPNGSSAVNITSGSGSFLLTSPLDPSVGYTVFAYLMPTNTAGRHAITGGSAPTALEYDIYNGNQDYLTEYTADIGHGTATIPTDSFSLINLAVNSAGASFRYNGTADGTVAGSSFGQPITRIGNNEGAGDGFVGQIAEIDIYSGALSYMQITNIEAQLTAKYVTANTIGVGAATVAPTNNTFAGNPITLSAPVVGATGSTTYQWQTDNGSGGSSFANIGGATTTNYVLNTASLVGTYEYQLVVTPFGGSSVTSAPVTLTVQPASAPVVATDTTANPSVATVGGNDTFSASFTGTLPISYQWQVSPNANGSGAMPVNGATNTTLTLTNLHLFDSGNYYSLRATNTISPYVANSTWLQLTVQPLIPAVQLIATNYDTNSGIWTDTSGNFNNATYGGELTNATIVPSVTPTGGAAVNVAMGDGSFVLTSPLDPSSGYTVFAYVMPSSTAGRRALTGGSAPTALEYDIYNGNQDYLTEYTADIGHGTAAIPTNDFSLINLAVNSAGASFRYNGMADGTVAGSSFGQPITRIGNNEGGGDGYVGQIAEIDIYSGALSYTQITNVESQLSAKYGALSAVAKNPTNIVAQVVGGNALQLTWPPDHTGWTLQVQTNALSAGLGTNWVSVAGSATTNQVMIPIGVNNGCVFYRLVLP